MEIKENVLKESFKKEAVYCKFAHMADCHLGRWTKEPHKSNELNAFRIAIENSVLMEVDFILISGDLFDSTVPNLDVADEVFKILKYAVGEGVRIYMIFGSHDNSRNRQSIAKLLVTSGIVTYVSGNQDEDGTPNFVIDEETRVKITGIDGLTGGVENQIYQGMDQEKLELEDGFKIFMFHSAINEYLPENLWMIEGVDLGLFPAGFDYYAGGHIHRMAITGDEDYPNVIYPGPLYGSDYRDFQKTAEGETKGYYMVTVSKGVVTHEFIPIELDQFIYREIKLVDLTAQQIKKRLREFDLDVEGKNVMIKLVGTLKGGSVGELHIEEFNKRLKSAGAKDVLTNTRGITVEMEELSVRKVEGMSHEAIINMVLEEEQEKFDNGHIGLTETSIQGKEGIKKAQGLLDILSSDRKYKEKKGDYENRISSEATAFFEGE